MLPATPAAVLFDLDGTLLDTESVNLDVSIQVLADMGFTASRDFFLSFVGRSDAESRDTVARAFPALDVELFEHNRKAAVLAHHAQGIPLKPGAVELLTALKAKGMPMAIGTNSLHVNGARKLRQSGLESLIPVLVTCDDVARAKPFPDIFIEAARLLGVNPAECVVFEDSDTGVLAAHAAGAFVVQVPDMVAPATDLADVTAPTLLDAARACGLIP